MKQECWQWAWAAKMRTNAVTQAGFPLAVAGKRKAADTYIPKAAFIWFSVALRGTCMFLPFLISLTHCWPRPTSKCS